MRLREPFQGYKLSSGHYMFHIAYLVGSIIATRLVLNESDLQPHKYDVAKPNDVLFQLNLAHTLVPIFTLISYICNKHDWNVAEKTFDIVSII